jgi:hypothetical protein
MVCWEAVQWLIESIESCGCERWEVGSLGQEKFGNPGEGERPSLKAATKQQLVYTATFVSGVCNLMRLS